MAPRQPIIAGKTVILLQLQDTIDGTLAGAKKKLNKFSSGLNKISFELFTGGLISGLPLTKTLKDFSSFEDRLLFLSTKLNATDEQMALVTERIRELGRSTSFTANEVADGAAVLAQAGLNATQVMDGLQATLDLARGNMITLEQAGAVLANTMTVFKIEGSQAGVVASQFTRAARLGTLDVLDLKESLKEVVGTLDTLNIDLPTSLALVTQLAQSSLKGTKAGTSLNTALLQLASKKDVLRDALGITIEDADGNLRPILDILDELLVRLNSLGDVARLAVVQRIFNIRGGRAVTGLLRDLANVRSLAKDIKTAGNEARDAAKKMDSGFGGAVRLATSSLLDLSITIGNLIGDKLQPLLRIVPAIASQFEKLAKANPELVVALAAVPPLLVGIGAAGLLASFTLNKLGGVVGLLGVAFQRVGSIFNKQFTGALIGGLAVQRRLISSLKSVDRTASALLLTPQRRGGAVPPGLLAQQSLQKAAAANARKQQIAQLALLQRQQRQTLAAQQKANPIQGPQRRALLLQQRQALASSQLIARQQLQTQQKAAKASLALSLKTAQDAAKAASGAVVPTSFIGRLGSKSFNGSIGGLVKSTGKLSVFTRVFTKLQQTVLRFRSGSLFIRFGRAIGTVFSSAGKALLKVDIVRILFNIARAGLSVVKVMGSLAAITFKTLTTLSGWGNILTLLILFGPRIKFIRDAFVRLGNGIASAFRQIMLIGTAAVPVFTLMREGIRSIIAGDGDTGIKQLGQGFSALVNIIGTQLSSAWATFTLALAPALDFMRKLIASTIELAGLFANLFGQTVGASFGRLSSAIAGGLGSSGGLGEVFKEIFNSINMKDVFAGIGAFFTGIAQSILDVLKFMADAVIDTLQVILSLVKAIASMPLFSGRLNDVAERAGGAAFRMGFNQRKSDKIFETLPNRMQESFEIFIKGLDNIFAKVGLGPRSIKQMNEDFTESMVQQDALEQANREAEKKRQQRQQKLPPGPAPIVSGALDVKLPDVPLVRQIQERIRQLTKNYNAAREAGDFQTADVVRDFLNGAKEELRKAQNQARGIVDRDTIRATLKARREALQKARKEAFENKQPISLQPGRIQDIVAATVGSIQSTRFNRLRVGSGGDPQREAAETLTRIEAQLGPSGGDPYLKQLVGEIGPPKFK